MEEPMKFYRDDYWQALPLLLSGALGSLGISVLSRFSMNGWAMAAGLIIITICLHFWSRNRYRMSL